MQDNYLERILKAKVYDVAVETPLEPAPRLSRRLDNRVLFKREDLQPVFSFKIRGAYNKIAQLSATAAQRGVICASAGNHAQGVALGARTRGIRAVVVMPVTTLALANTGGFTRFVRASMIETLRQDHVRTARAKGAGEGRVVLVHAFRNALIPVITVMALNFGSLFGGALLFTESRQGLPQWTQRFFGRMF